VQDTKDVPVYVRLAKAVLAGEYTNIMTAALQTLNDGQAGGFITTCVVWWITLRQDQDPHYVSAPS